MSCYEPGTVLVPFKRFFVTYPRAEDLRDKFPYFRVHAAVFGTKGYTYHLEAYNAEKRKWVLWGTKVLHLEVEKNFRYPTKAEQVLYGPFDQTVDLEWNQ